MPTSARVFVGLWLYTTGFGSITTISVFRQSAGVLLLAASYAIRVPDMIYQPTGH